MIRVWKLGSLEYKILPTVEEIEAFAKILGSRNGDKTTMDIIWGPDIECMVVKDDYDLSNSDNSLSTIKYDVILVPKKEIINDNK